MRHESRKMDVELSVAAGDPLQVDRFTQKTVHVHGSFNATVQLQGKIASRPVVTKLGVGSLTAGPDDDAHDEWVNVGAAVASAGPAAAALITCTDANGAEFALTHLRVSTTAYTAGTPLVTFGGFDSRSDTP